MNGSALGTTGAPDNNRDNSTLNINVDFLSLRNGAFIGPFDSGGNNPGDINIVATEAIEIIGVDERFRVPARISTTRSTNPTGNTGNLNITTPQLKILQGGQIVSRTFGDGDAGRINIRADVIEIAENVPDSRLVETGIIANVVDGASGNGGVIDIETDYLRIDQGGQITTSTEGIGNGGLIDIQANTVEVVGQASTGTPRSAIASSSTTDAAAGSINIAANRLTVSDGAQISFSSTGEGDAGNLMLVADTIRLDSGSLESQVAAGTQGNLQIKTESGLLLRNGSLITTNATNTATGGNIIIDSPVIVAIPAENSDIVANAIEGNGGNIQITTTGIFGLEFRPKLTPLSDITASSQFGVDGIVQIQTPDLDPNQGIVELPVDLADPSNQISTGCLVAADNSLTVSGRSGLPNLPDVPNNSTVWEDWRPLETENEVKTASIPSMISHTPLREATEMRVDANGQITFVASTDARSSPSVGLAKLSFSNQCARRRT